ncbi:MAG: helix-turn-helix transcriptional regulator [Bifidobacteriaceae bacterium]|jgi:MerR family transcriptional regulator/heat shock protein HspR|nr:helix-turn-helix transcriptional regulator [Bifidobacteriaceae bacterium]
MSPTVRIDVRVAVAGPPDEDTPLYLISQAAQLAGMHPQTLRQYDRLGLVVPGRARGRGRRYSLRDVATLREVQRLSAEEGINLAGIKRILHLEKENRELRAQLENLKAAAYPGRRVFAVAASGDAVSLARGQRAPREPSSQGRALVLWRP